MSDNADQWMSLANYSNGGYQPGRSVVVRTIWYIVSAIVFESPWFPVFRIKRWILRLFGASIGKQVVIKPSVRIKYPWRLKIGDYSWIGEEVWIDNLVDVQIGKDACISQGVYICTGGHDCQKHGFDLITAPVVIGDESWIAARSLLLPGVTIEDGTVAAAGSVVVKGTVHNRGALLAGVPARKLADRLRKAAF